MNFRRCWEAGHKFPTYTQTSCRFTGLSFGNLKPIFNKIFNRDSKASSIFQRLEQPLDREAVEPGPRLGHAGHPGSPSHSQAAVQRAKDCAEVRRMNVCDLSSLNL